MWPVATSAATTPARSTGVPGALSSFFELVVKLMVCLLHPVCRCPEVGNKFILRGIIYNPGGSEPGCRLTVCGAVQRRAVVPRRRALFHFSNGKIMLLYRLSNLTLAYGDKPLLDGVDLTIH